MCVVFFFDFIIFRSFYFLLMVLLPFALPTSDTVVTRTPLHRLYDFWYELLSSRLSYFSFRSLVFDSTIFSVSSNNFAAVMKFMSELVVPIRRIISLFQRRVFPTSNLCFFSDDVFS